MAKTPMAKMRQLWAAAVGVRALKRMKCVSLDGKGDSLSALVRFENLQLDGLCLRAHVPIWTHMDTYGPYRPIVAQ